MSELKVFPYSKDCHYILAVELLLDYIHQYVSLNKEAEKAILVSFKTKEYPNGKKLLRKGDTCRNLYFMLRGTVRTFFYQSDKDVTTWIYPEGYFFTAWSSFINNQPGHEFIELVEDSQIAFITKEALDILYDQHASIERFGRYLAEEQLASIDEYSKGYLFLSAREKYDLLLSFFPDVTQRVNLGHIASLLGITQETLSRIRGKKTG
ncbi:Crp/Fnr family transcriptional regulator [Fulvivirgaceae bacterium BMA10]|uniref:Crp/Fnr family transcriptional regulator n=1 Tax=Splendidivirga corallicola TaxID=3051826 RepID=A0ABT8KNZ2_9BACT|nr:Crp/Fnr family transcriptional regulator [Fulvivirgaceae bacterium BMA10]